jgi:transposase-like protein
MSGRRRWSSAEFKVEAAHQVIDTVRSITEVASELTLDKNALGVWVRAERARMEA